ncbi:hypothetical protein A3Q56_06787 [Intoshia linei]|uniref:Uncharacterized protein n=1 Tax=Intoshia linei TaxID=1819745 RepID=A0A177AU08_9BILA|nr:hypothetical protein A3Q56_06787 [Intoshia linei]
MRILLPIGDVNMLLTKTVLLYFQIHLP